MFPTNKMDSADYEQDYEQFLRETGQIEDVAIYEGEAQAEGDAFFVAEDTDSPDVVFCGNTTCAGPDVCGLVHTELKEDEKLLVQMVKERIRAYDEAHPRRSQS